MNRKVLNAILTIALLLSLFPIISVNVSAADKGVITFYTDRSDGVLTRAQVNTQIAAAGIGSSDTFEATFDDSVKIIGDGTLPDNGAFYTVDSLIRVVIPEGVTTLNLGAFHYCHNLESVVFPKSLTYIGNHAFCQNYNLKNVFIPKNVAYIGDYAFYSCTALENIMIPDSISAFGPYTFYNCSRLTMYSSEPSYAHTYAVTNRIPWVEYIYPSTVTFVDWDDKVLSVQDVDYGLSATAPDEPTRTGYQFIGWDVSFGCITDDLTVTALYDAALVDAVPTAFVTKLAGNKNSLTITVTETYFDGVKKTITETFMINNNAADTYDVGPYKVYVDTKGNTQIRACFIK